MACAQVKGVFTIVGNLVYNKGMGRKSGIGEQELALWRYVAQHAPVRSREVQEGFGTPNGLSRTTVLTMLERLWRKGYLKRTEKEGTFYYEPALSEESLHRQLLQRFVDNVLGGSVTPFVSYLVESQSLTPEETEVLRQLVERLKEQGG